MAFSTVVHTLDGTQCDKCRKLPLVATPVIGMRSAERDRYTGKTDIHLINLCKKCLTSMLKKCNVTIH